MRESTRDKLLDTAEQIFADKGFDGASLRSITRQAGTNLASINYHFGSKEGLLQAVIERRIGPVNRQRLNRLDACEAEAGEGPAPLEKVLEAFIAPALELRELFGAQGRIFVRLMGRIHAEPGRFYQLVRDSHQEVAQRFHTAMQRALPNLAPEEVGWGMMFMLGSLVFTMIHDCRLFLKSPPESPDVQAVTRRLITFTAAAMRGMSVIYLRGGAFS